jgi:hypothetical protein
LPASWRRESLLLSFVPVISLTRVRDSLRIEAHEPDAAWAMYRHLDGRTQQ